ncbi:MAG: hypothetical protein IKQ97_04680 [Eubacterium sp.]|nr:hypothetical protein [Eubacterium sp.]
MTELIDSLINMAAMVICTTIAFCYAYNSHGSARRAWVLYGLFTGEYFLGDLYSALILAFYDEAPMYYIPDVAWDTSYLFIILLLLYVSERTSIKMMSWAQLLIPVFTVSWGVVFVVTHGDIIGNVISAVEMAIAMWLAGGGLELERQKLRVIRRQGASATFPTTPNRKPFYTMALVILALEYGFWISTISWMGDTFLNPYYWINFLFCISCFLMIPALKKAVGRPGE